MRSNEMDGVRTMTVRPLVYTSLFPAELSLVAVPRTVVGLQGYIWPVDH